ncbi:MAG: ISLre2 family transposase [Firmicutes bacterium]|nr:ISLre2 family transposase [Bacillota bacterium]
METIVQQIIMELGKNICKRIEKEGLSDIDRFATDALDLCKGSVRDLISGIARQLNEELRADKSFRKEQGLVLKEKDRERSLLTEVGRIDIVRDYYHERAKDAYVYPLDSILGIPAYERVSANVSAGLVSLAAEVSYEKSAKIATDGEVSRQTVKNKLRAVGKLEKAVPEEKRVAAELHIFADEDHAHLQDGKNRIVPLITISEGTRVVHTGRNALVNPVHFSSTMKATKEAWERVGGYIGQAYEEDKIQKIYLHGDGAAWIKQGIEELGICQYVMDGYHFEKHLKRATAAFPKQNYRYRIRQAIKDKSLGKVTSLIREMFSLSKGVKQEKRVREFLQYVVNNWDGIVQRYTKGIVGSCTEGLVSHVYSERLSRNPMGWSEAGLNKMAELRVYTRNGCRVSGEDFKRPEEEKNRSILKEYGKERLRNAIRGCSDWSIFEKEPYSPAVNTATQVLIRSYGRLQSLVG